MGEVTEVFTERMKRDLLMLSPDMGTEEGGTEEGGMAIGTDTRTTMARGLLMPNPVIIVCVSPMEDPVEGTTRVGLLMPSPVIIVCVSPMEDPVEGTTRGGLLMPSPADMDVDMDVKVTVEVTPHRAMATVTDTTDEASFKSSC